MVSALVIYQGLCDASCSLVGLPLIGHGTLAVSDGQVIGIYVEVHIKSFEIRFLYFLYAGQEQLIPEQGLKRIERDALFPEKIHLAIVCFYVFFVQAVHYQYVIRREL